MNVSKEEFVSNIQAMMDAQNAKKAKAAKKADAEYTSWASWKYDDGDSGAAYEHEKYKTIKAAAVYLFNCNWRSYANEREIAV